MELYNSEFAYGGFVAVGRACALIHLRDRGQEIVKRVKIYSGELFDDRDRYNILNYVRLISEYEAARKASEQVLKEGEKSLVLMDGSLYFPCFHYAIRDYQHHPILMAELFEAVSSIYKISVTEVFPFAVVSKDSSAFYLHMMLLKEATIKAGLKNVASLLEKASSPHDLRLKMVDWLSEDKEAFEPLLDAVPLCDIALIGRSVSKTGFSTPRTLNLL